MILQFSVSLSGEFGVCDDDDTLLPRQPAKSPCSTSLTSLIALLESHADAANLAAPVDESGKFVFETYLSDNSQLSVLSENVTGHERTP